jgi:ribonucleotide reductase beta subunit family protein with ferritin-like domain
MSSNTLTRLTSILPVQDKELFALLQQAKATFWTEDEIDLSNDLVDWQTKLNDTEKDFISHILGFFVQSDQLVNINLGDRFLIDIESIPIQYSKYAKLFYNFQVAIEDIHTLMYETLLNEFIVDQDQLLHFKNSIENIPAVSKKAQWAVKYIDDKESNFLVRLIAFAILEGIFFSGSFCAIFWLGERNLMRGLVNSNKFISRDENLHYEFALCLFKKLRDDDNYNESIDPEIIKSMIVDAVNIETQFINESISCSMVGMNVELMTQYIQFVADQLLKDINMEPIYKSVNPFSFMTNLGLCDKSNFFEQRETVYQKAVSGKLEYNSDSDNDF